MWRAIGILVYGLTGSLGILVADTDRPSRPNIVLLVSDDMGWNDVSFMYVSFRSFLCVDIRPKSICF